MIPTVFTNGRGVDKLFETIIELYEGKEDSSAHYRQCFFRIAIKLLSFLLLNLGIYRLLFLINSEYILLITIISISYFTRNHKHEIDNCLYNNSR